jgi:Tfp pilus assembly PilM family ATPase
MWNDLVTLYIDDTSIRLMVCQGQVIKKWAVLKLEPGLIKGGFVLQEAEVTNKIKQLLQSQEVRTRKVVLGFSGIHSLTRPATLPQLPKAMLPEAVVREARRVLPVPLDQLYLFWHTIPGPKGKIQIYIAATPRNTVDSLVKVIRGAGLEPSRMAIKPLSLTKLIPTDTAILVDLQPNEFDIAIMVDGVAQPIRTIILPNEEISPEQKSTMISNDVDRTINFFDTNNTGKTLDTRVPIYVSGEILGKPDLQNILAQKTGHPVMILPPTLKGPDEIDPEIYTTNIALATKTARPGREATFPLADMNLLPVPYQPKPISLTKVMAIPGVIALAGLVVPMIMMMQNVSNVIDSTQNQLDITNQLINKQTLLRTNLKKQVADLQNQANALKAPNDQLSLAIDFLSVHQEYMKGDLMITLSKIVPAITLKSVTASEGTLTLQGTAPNKEDVYTYAQAILQYARELESSQRYSQTIVSSITLTPPEIEPAPTPAQGETATPTPTPTIHPGTINFVLIFEREGPR